MPSPSRPIERARPLLGTVVRIRVEGLEAMQAHEAIGGAFRIISDIHRLMSFQDPHSELSRLNREACRTSVPVSPHTRTVLDKALEIARASDGLFDPAVAPALVDSGLSPAPGADAPDPAATWRDIAVSADGRVCFGRPMWIDLSGIAKGYAVDCALAHLEACRPTRICVEAGGDLRLAGRGAERVFLAAPAAGPELAALEVENAAVASSGGQATSGGLAGPHIDPRTKTFCPPDRFVTVVAPNCMEADALTKVVMVAGADAAPLLAGRQAQAYAWMNAAWSCIADAA